ncbi:MAG: ComEC/Rec2 family competence protein [Zymomonas mobilis]
MFSFGGWLEQKLEQEGDQLPLWLPIAFGGGILLWFTIPNSDGWIGCGCLLLALGLMAWPWAGKKRAAKAILIMVMAGCFGMADIWFRAYYVAPIAPPNLGVCEVRGQILQSEQQPSRKRMRLVIAAPLYLSSLAAMDAADEEPASTDKSKLHQGGRGQVFGHREVRYNQDEAAAKRLSFAEQGGDADKNELSDNGLVFANRVAAYPQDKDIAKRSSFILQVASTDKSKSYPIEGSQSFTDRVSRYHRDGAVVREDSFADQRANADIDKLRQVGSGFAYREVGYHQSKAVTEGNAFLEKDADKTNFRRVSGGWKEEGDFSSTDQGSKTEDDSGKRLNSGDVAEMGIFCHEKKLRGWRHFPKTEQEASEEDIDTGARLKAEDAAKIAAMTGIVHSRPRTILAEAEVDRGKNDSAFSGTKAPFHNLSASALGKPVSQQRWASFFKETVAVKKPLWTVDSIKAAVSAKKAEDGFAPENHFDLGQGSHSKQIEPRIASLFRLWPASEKQGLHKAYLASVLPVSMPVLSTDFSRFPFSGWLGKKTTPSPHLIHIRISVSDRFDFAGLEAGAKIAIKAKLTPPMPAIVPAGYDYAEIAWFQGISATGHALGQPVILARPVLSGFSLVMASIHQKLTRHIIKKVGEKSGGIAAAFVTNDVGSISESDTVAMRKAGLTHLLSVGGMHIGVVIAAVMFITIRLLALSPYLALHFPLRMIAACNAALAGMVYTFVAGCEIPTVRSMLTAFFILFGMMIGRKAVSLRLVAAAAMLILMIQPETILSPSFQLSFAAVATVIALAEAPLMEIFANRREAGWLKKTALIVAEIIIGGVMVEAVVSPITLYHFHQSGFYGALANILAIPLTTFITIPAEALALVTDPVGCSAPFWWVTDQSIRLLIAIAHYVAALPMAGFMLPMIGAWLCLFMMAGWLWLGLWQTSWRLWGLVPLVLGVIVILLNPKPDWVISRDGKTIAFKTDNPKQPYSFVWPDKDSYSQDQIANLIGFDQEEESRLFGRNLCQKGLCNIAIDHQRYHLLAIKGKVAGLSSEECGRNDWVVSSGNLPVSCNPQMMKIDRPVLAKMGGLVFYEKSIFLRRPKMVTGYSVNDRHPWMGNIRAQS